MINTITATQKFNAIHLIIRVNATELYVYTLSNTQDLDSFIDEVSAVLDKKSFLELYHIATSEPYSFLKRKINGLRTEWHVLPHFHTEIQNSRRLNVSLLLYLLNMQNTQIR